MAIIKNFQTAFGINANYHKIIKIEILCQQEIIEYTVAIYASQETKESNSKPLWNEYIRIPFTSFNSDPRQAFYPIIEQYYNSYLKGGASVVNDVLDVPNALILKPTETVMPPNPSDEVQTSI